MPNISDFTQIALAQYSHLLVPVVPAKPPLSVRQTPVGELNCYLPVKTNVSLEARGLVFRLPEASAGVMPRVEWERMAEELALQTALAPSRSFDLKAQLYRDQESFCVAWLREELSDGPKDRALLQKQAATFTDAQLHRASEYLGVLKFKESFNGGWVWMLPEHFDQWQTMRDKMRRVQRSKERRENKRRKELSARMKALRAAKAMAKSSEQSTENSNDDDLGTAH